MRLPVQLQPGESVVLTVHRHWFFLVAPLTLSLMVMLVPPLILLTIVGRTDAPRLVDVIVVVLSLAYLVAFGMRAYFVWYAWMNDVWVITNQRLVDGQKRHWFHEEVSTADLMHVQDVALDRHGVLATLLKFGDLRVQTAAEVEEFILRKIPRPQDVLAILDRTRDTARRDASPLL
ncbi:MAG: PH domain-containing protein [Dehalococcoidia bacterium]|nr:MAG: PH domain-containing protein [Dehalococcoidia bacterium]